MRRLSLGWLVFLLLSATGSPAAGARLQYEWEGVPRIVAVGDVHGAYDNLVNVLKNAGLIDDELDWVGGEAHLVQVGDVVDRGANSRRCLDLLMELEQEAERAGGQVHVLIGNHEAFHVTGITDHTTPEEFRSYVDLESEDIRERSFMTFFRQQIEAGGTRRRGPNGDARGTFDEKYPPGYFGHREAFEQDGYYGRWILEHNVAVRLNGIVFSHGDWSVEISALGIEKVNEEVRKELRGEASLENGVTFHVQGPLQYRGLAEVPLTDEQQKAHADEVNQILANLQAQRMVVGHTVTKGVIEPRFGGKHISIDTGMLEIYDGGHQIALEIQGDLLSAIHSGGKVPLPDHLDETTTFEYWEDVATVDKNNYTLYVQLSEAYGERGDLEGARRSLEQLFRGSHPVPFGYNRSLGDVYQEMGMPEAAREQYLVFIDGFKSLITQTPSNPLLKNVLIRFCVDKGLELDMAEEMLRQALKESPKDPSFLLTLGRFQIAQRQFRQAVESLEKSIELGTPGYEAYYHLGLARLGMGETAEARQAFELAIQADPTGEGAREELQKLVDSQNLSKEEVQTHE